MRLRISYKQAEVDGYSGVDLYGISFGFSEMRLTEEISMPYVSPKVRANIVNIILDCRGVKDASGPWFPNCKRDFLTDEDHPGRSINFIYAFLHGAGMRGFDLKFFRDWLGKEIEKQAVNRPTGRRS